MKLNLLGTTFEVKEMPKTFAGELCGRIDVENAAIFLREDLDPEYRFRTLIHEMVHYADHFTQCELEEKAVTILANALDGMIRTNFEQLGKMLKDV